jgi:phosphoglycolate phosphatase-like HAD superfamily hydrolase
LRAEPIIGSLVEALALDLDAVLGDTRPLWRAWLEDLRRRARVEVELPEDRAAAARVLDGVVGNWRALLERFAEEHAPIHLRPSAEVNAALRRLSGAGVRLGAFTDAPEPLARVAAAQLGVARRLEALESGPDAVERLLERLGPATRIVRSTAELAG